MKYQFITVPLLLFGAVVISSTANSQPESKIEPTERVSLTIESRLTGSAESAWRFFDFAYPRDNGFEVEVRSVAQGNQNGDTVLLELGLYDAIDACEREEINLLPIDKVLPEDVEISGYVWNAIQPCAIGHSIWADLSVFDTTRFIDQVTPTALDDFFNIDFFPGKRAIKKSPRVLAEWSLLRSGIPQEKIYDALATDAAWALVEETLDQLSPEIRWVDTDTQALELLDSGAVTFALVSSRSLVQRIARNQQSNRAFDHYGSIWQQAVAHMSLLAVPKVEFSHTETERLEWQDSVVKFLKQATDPLSSLRLSTMAGYAPAGLSHAGLIDSAYRSALAIKPNTDALFWASEKWWRENGSALEMKFQQFVASEARFNTVLR